MKKKLLHLTFDGAPHPPRTEALLEVCAEFDIKATFFLEGHRLGKEPETARKIIAAGHSVGNHSYSHSDLLELPMEQCVREIARTDELIAQELHLTTSLVRPPNGHVSEEFAAYLKAQGKRTILWSISVKDWIGPDANSLAERTLALLKDPEYVVFPDCGIDTEKEPYFTMVFHDFVEWNPEALRIIIPEAKKMGYRFEALNM